MKFITDTSHSSKIYATSAESASTISGIVFYGLDFFGSLVYQLTYLGPSMLICLVALILLYKPLLIINSLFPTK